MPHIVVKLWPGQSIDEKQRLCDAIVAGVSQILGHGEASVSVGFEEIAASDWTAAVYEPDIAAKWSTLLKQPGYGSGPA